MARMGIRDLVGRAMIDAEFLAELARNPAAVLDEYDLTPEERGVIMKALTQLGGAPARERAQAIQAVMMKRWAT
jgi:hypothetical protein